MCHITDQINARSRENFNRMNLRTYNQAEIVQMKAIRDRLQWFLGEELGRDPRDDPKDLVELENRFAHWLLEENGGEQLRKSTLNQGNKC